MPKVNETEQLRALWVKAGLDILDQNIKITQLRDELAAKDRRIKELISTLRLVATGIHRDREANRVWLTGESVVVHAIEEALLNRRRVTKKRKG